MLTNWLKGPAPHQHMQITQFLLPWKLEILEQECAQLMLKKPTKNGLNKTIGLQHLAITNDRTALTRTGNYILQTNKRTCHLVKTFN